MFVCAESGDGKITPGGTAFIVGLPGEHGAWLKYFVTAGHCVRSEPRWIRFRRHDGGAPEDVLVGGWVSHSTADIAAAPCDLDTTQYIANWQEEQYFSDKFPPGVVVDLGTHAYYVGLLTHVPTMADKAIPMMRAANVGALYAEDVPVRDCYPDGTPYARTEPQAHIIDTYARGGFSGSPVYVDHSYVNMWPVDDKSIAVQLTSFSALLGVLVGHFSSEGDNAGVALVVPIEAVRELLNDQQLVDWRNRKAGQMEANRKKEIGENAAQLDSLQDESEFARFEALSRRLVNVPKKEIDERRKDEG
ncbi:MAG: hypothetical protein ACR2KV_03920 [Solirubrobacteraceae bacterium]